MKSLLLFVFLYLSYPFVYGEEPSLPIKNNLKTEEESNKHIKPNSKTIKNKKSETSLTKADLTTQKGKPEENKKVKTDIKEPDTAQKNTTTEEDKKVKTDTKEPDTAQKNTESFDIRSSLVTQKIKKVFIDFIEIIEKEPLESDEYKKAVSFLENSLYGEASFETLKLLATVYKEKNDLINQLKVLNILSINYPNKPESFYLLGMGYKYLYLYSLENPKRTFKNISVKTSDKGKTSKDSSKAVEKVILEGEDDTRKYKEKSIESFNQALKIDRKYILAHKALMSLFMVENPKTGERIHTRESLSVAMDILKTFRKKKHYIQLCKAYYDNKFFKQSRKACAKSVQKNPNDPVSPFILALSKKNKKDTNKELLATAKKFTNSFFVQYKTALFFMDKDPTVATTYFDSAYALRPKNMRLNKIMAKFLFDNKEEKKSYEHFLNTCLLTNGKFLKDFRTAKRQLRRKQKPELISTFQKGIDECFLSAKKSNNNKMT